MARSRAKDYDDKRLIILHRSAQLFAGSGYVGTSMNMIADVYERELDKQVQVTSALIPPVIMIVIAAIVGLVVFGVLDAVFNLTTGLRTRMH